MQFILLKALTISMFKSPQLLIYLLAVAAFLHPSTSSAQEEQEVIELNLHDALELARTNYPGIKKRLAEKSLAESQTKTAQSLYLPDVGVLGQAILGTSNQIHGMFQNYDGLLTGLTGATRQYSFDAKPTWSSALSMVVDWQAFTFGRKNADLEIGNSQIDLGNQLYEQELFEHQIKVADTYLLALNANKYAQLQERNVRRTENIVSVTRANASSGLKAGIDSSIAVAEATRALLLWMNSQVEAEKQMVMLSELIGQAGADIKLDTMQFFFKIPETYRFEVTDPQLHPRLVSMQFRKKVLEQQVGRIKLNNKPEFHLMGTLWGRGSGISQQLNASNQNDITASLSGLKLRAYNYGLGATLIWHPSRLFITRNQVTEQNRKIDILEQEYQQTLQKTKASLKNADIQFNLAFQSVKQTPIQLHAARQAYRQSRSRYENGLENIMLLTQVVDLYNRAETEYILSVSNLWRTLLIKAASKGDFSVFMDQIPE